MSRYYILNGERVHINVLHSLAKQAGFKDEVPDIEDFIHDPYYLGKVLGDSLYPIWVKSARDIYPTPYHSPYDEIILTGGIGQGKSTFGLLMIFYDLCKLFALEDPYKYYSLISSTTLCFPLMNATKGLAVSVLWNQFESWVEQSPFFSSKVATQGSTYFKGKIDVTIGSRGRDFLGQATIGALFSELNDMTVVGGQAEDSLDTISTRRTSRFANKNREICGHLILDSSSKGNRSFIEERIEEKKRQGEADYLVIGYTHWEAKWHLGGYSGEFFQVYAGDESRDPFIIDETNYHLLPGLKKERIIDVPVEHKQDFVFNIIKALRDLAGISTFSTFSFISSQETINKALILPSIATKKIIELSFSDQSQKIIDHVDIDNSIAVTDLPRYIHIDLGLKNDHTGIACSIQNGSMSIIRRDYSTGREYEEIVPTFTTEWVLEIKAETGDEVPIYKIKDFILDCKSRGLNIGVVSTDGFQSSNLRQDLRLKGIETQLISVDRIKDPYDHLRNLILEGRLICPNNDKLKNEMRFLEDTGPKYDHPPGGSKDLLDAVCGSVWSCWQNYTSVIAPKNHQVSKSMTTLDHILSDVSGSPSDDFITKLTNSVR